MTSNTLQTRSIQISFDTRFPTIQDTNECITTNVKSHLKSKNDSQSLHALAQIYEKEGDTPNMLKYYKLATKQHNIDSMIKLATYYEQADPNNAISFYESAFTLQNDSCIANNLGICYYKIGNLQKAKYFFEKALPTTNPQIFINLAITHNEIDDNTNYIKYLEIASQIGHPQAASIVALHYLTNHDLDNAKKYFLLALPLGTPSIYTYVASVCQQQKAYNEAIKYYELVIDDLFPTDITNLALCYHAIGDIVNTRKCFELALALLIPIQDQQIILHNLAKICHDQGDTDATIKYFCAAIEIGHMTAANDLGILYISRGDFVQARHYLELALQTVPSASTDLALICEKQNDFPNMIKYAKLAVQRNCHKSAIRLGNYYFGRKKFNKALKYHMFAINGGHTDFLINAAVCYQMLGDVTNAKKYNKLAFWTGEIRAAYNIGRICAQQKRYRQALIWYKHALTKTNANTSKAKILNSIAISYYKLGNIIKAKRYFTLSGNAIGLHNLGIISRKQGNIPEMIKYFRMAATMGHTLFIRYLRTSSRSNT